MTQPQALARRATIDLSRLDEAVEALCTRLLMLMPDCVSKTINSVRKHKQHFWDANSITNREWLALNMMTEGRAGFRAFNEGPKDRREVDFIRLRQLLAEGHPWDEELVRAISPQYQTRGSARLEPEIMDLALGGRTALVTGGAAGIGAAIALGSRAKAAPWPSRIAPGPQARRPSCVNSRPWGVRGAPTPPTFAITPPPPGWSTTSCGTSAGWTSSCPTPGSQPTR